MTEEEEQLLVEFGIRLKKLRMQKNLSQEKFADITQLDRTYISGLERGKRNPSFIILLKLAICLNSPITDLFPEVNHEKH